MTADKPLTANVEGISHDHGCETLAFLQIDLGIDELRVRPDRGLQHRLKVHLGEERVL